VRLNRFNSNLEYLIKDFTCSGGARSGDIVHELAYTWTEIGRAGALGSGHRSLPWLYAACIVRGGPGCSANRICTGIRWTSGTAAAGFLALMA
jgi:hypothetical protein